MTIVVVAVHEECPAVVALRSYRLPFDLVRVRDEFTYGQTLTRYWQAGETFINVEHDIVPWPGALEALWACDRPAWCGYEYPVGYSGKFGRSLGCVLFHDAFLRTHPDVSWTDVPWSTLDASIYRTMGQTWHTHVPPVAHLTPLKTLAGISAVHSITTEY
jgi:hypothetical protein